MSKCCGTCKWWDYDPKYYRRDGDLLGDCTRVGDCPACLELVITRHTEGEDCPLYEAKDSEKE